MTAPKTDEPTTSTANVRGREQWGHAVREYEGGFEGILRLGYKIQQGEGSARVRVEVQVN